MPGNNFTSREKFLAGLFVFIIFGVGIFMLTDSLSDYYTKLTDQETALLLKQQEADHWFAQKAILLKRQNWLLEHLPSGANSSETSSQFLEMIQKGAASHSLKITQQSLDPLTETQGLYSVSAKITFQGSMKDVTSFLVELQQPGKFVSIPAFHLKSGQDKMMTCDLQITRWFQSPSNRKTAVTP